MTQESKQPELKTEQPGISVTIQRIYLKDISYESTTPEIFTQEWKPKLDFNIHYTSKNLAPEVHEVVLELKLTATVQEKTAFIVEVQQAGIFNIHNAPQEQLEPIMAIYCPNILFPYARETIASLTMNGGFPPVQLAHINFDAIYQERMAKANASADAAS